MVGLFHERILTCIPVFASPWFSGTYRSANTPNFAEEAMLLPYTTPVKTSVKMLVRTTVTKSVLVTRITRRNLPLSERPGEGAGKTLTTGRLPAAERGEKTRGYNSSVRRAHRGTKEKEGLQQKFPPSVALHRRKA